VGADGGVALRSEHTLGEPAHLGLEQLSGCRKRSSEVIVVPVWASWAVSTPDLPAYTDVAALPA
jgi:hypothetical protein